VWGGVIGATALLALGLGGSLLAAVGGAAGALLAAPIAISALRHRRARRTTAAIPPMIEQIASELRAGGTIATAVAGIAAGDSVLAGDFARVEARVALGASLVDALRAWVGERDADGVDAAAGALAMCATVGGPGADALEGLAASLRDRLSVVAEARALSAQARMSAVVVGGTPLVYIAWSAFADRGALNALTGTTAGRVCLLVGLVLEGLGAWWMHRILVNGSVL
jgi:tight adherence protein B